MNDDRCVILDMKIVIRTTTVQREGQHSLSNETQNDHIYISYQIFPENLIGKSARTAG